MKRRNVFEVSRDILKVCLTPKNKTRVVYGANLNNVRVNHYLDSLVKMGLLQKETTGDVVSYHTTDMGLRFLDNYGKNFSGKRSVYSKKRLC
ncbi:MAG: winged helix-turn-helix domain-containing protein [Candidatus Bathyarchaeia archaeon]